MPRIATVLVFNKLEAKNTKEKLERTLVWYDGEAKETLTFKGGRLDLFNKVYSTKYKRFVPKVTDVFVNKQTSIIDDRSAIKWFNKFTNYNNTKAAVIFTVYDGVVFEVPLENDDLDNFLYDLERNGLSYRIEQISDK
jgi:hypothetical protein